MKNDQTVYTENSIRTYTGKVFDLKILDPDSISIEDIAHALSYTARFGGHLQKPYSVAQHSVYASNMASAENKLAALMHDASEAYIGDMPSPFKKLMPDFKFLENNLMKVIAKKYGFQYPFHLEIKEIDQQLLDWEWNEFVVRKDFSRYTVPSLSKEMFLNRFRILTK